MCARKDSDMTKTWEFEGELWATYKQEGASAFFGCSIIPGEAKQRRDAALYQAQLVSVKQACRGPPLGN